MKSASPKGDGKHDASQGPVPLGSGWAKGWQGPQGPRAFAPTRQGSATRLQDQAVLKIVFSLALQKREVIKSKVI